jgi:hypothetical protein
MNWSRKDLPMGDNFTLACPGVPTLGGSEVRFSVAEPLKLFKMPGLEWPLEGVTCGEIIPSQPRTQWGLSTTGARYDSYSGLRLGSSSTNLTLGARSTYTSADAPLGPVERQRVGVAALTLGGRVRFKYWNDHDYWWWPMGDGGDHGDTSGFQFTYNLAPHSLTTHGWLFEDFSLTLRLASGVPDLRSPAPMGDGQVYSEVRFKEVNRGDLDLSTTLSRRAERLDVGILVNSDAIRRATQDRAIPEFPQTGNFDVMLYLRLSHY